MFDALLAALPAVDAFSRAAPLLAFTPPPKLTQLGPLISDARVKEIHVEGANKAGKSKAVAGIVAALLLGEEGRAERAHLGITLRRKWPERGLSVAVLGPTAQQVQGDPLKHLRAMLPEPVRKRLASRTSSVYQLPGGTLRVIGCQRPEQARQVLQGGDYHLIWFNEEVSPILLDEAIPRGAMVDGVILNSTTLGLESTTQSRRHLDPDKFLERALRGPWCGHPMCQHTGEDNPAYRHIWLEFTPENVPWMSRRRFDAYVDQLPAETRDIRLGKSRGRIVTGRCYSAIHRGVQIRPLDVGEVIRMAPDPGRVELGLVVDCGKVDAMAALIAAVYPHGCESCQAADPGWLLCTKCQGRPGRRSGCHVCEGEGRIICLTCDGMGIRPEIWCLASYQSRSGSTTLDNVGGIREACVTAGLVDGRGQPDLRRGRFDWFVGDNQMPKQFPEFRGELEALHAKLGGTLPAPAGANKRPSYVWSWERANRLARMGMLHLNERAESLVRMVEGWAYGPKGTLPAHDGPEGLSHSDAVMRYLMNRVCW